MRRRHTGAPLLVRGVAGCAAGTVVLASAVLGWTAGAAVAADRDAAPHPSGAPAASPPAAPAWAPVAATVHNTDLYAFVSPDRPDTVTLTATFSASDDADGDPRPRPFATDMHYDINIDNNGDGIADVTYRWTFRDGGQEGTAPRQGDGAAASLRYRPPPRQRYTLESFKPGEATSPLVRAGWTAGSNVGMAAGPDRHGAPEHAVTHLAGGALGFAGPADDPSFLDTRAFDPHGVDQSGGGHDGHAGRNLNAIAVQVPKHWLCLDADTAANPVIGVWGSAERLATNVPRGDSGPPERWVQVSRQGNPLFADVILPAGVRDIFRSLRPDRDRTVPQVARRVADPVLPRLFEQQLGLPAPATPRDDLTGVFLTGMTARSGGPIRTVLNSQLMNAGAQPERFVPSEQLRLNITTPPAGRPNRLGVIGGDPQGFPNGRRLGDDVADIELQILEGAARTGRLVGALRAGDHVDANDVAFGPTFPYLALPHPWRADPGGQAGALPPGDTEVRGSGAMGMRRSYAAWVLGAFGTLGLLLTGLAGWVLRRGQRAQARRLDPGRQ